MRRQAHRNRRPGSPRGQGLVNVNLQGIDIVVPVAVAANICDVSVNALASQIGAGETACTTTADAGAVFGPGGSSGGTQQRGLVNVKRRGRHRARAGRRRSEYLRPRRERAGPAEGVWPHDLRGHRPERGVARRSRRQRKASRCSLSTATPTLNCDSSLTWSEAPPARREGGRNLALSAGLRLSAPQPPEGVAHGRGRPGGCPSHIEFFRVPPSERQGTAHRRSDIHTLPGQKAPSLQGLRERVLSRARRPPGQLGGDTARQPSRLPPRPATTIAVSRCSPASRSSISAAPAQSSLEALRDGRARWSFRRNRLRPEGNRDSPVDLLVWPRRRTRTRSVRCTRAALSRGSAHAETSSRVARRAAAPIPSA